MANNDLNKQAKNSTEEQQFNSRINSLEMRNAFQDDVIEQLNTELTNHQEEIVQLKYQLKLIAGRIKDINPADQADNNIEPPPPHY